MAARIKTPIVTTSTVLDKRIDIAGVTDVSPKTVADPDQATHSSIKELLDGMEASLGFKLPSGKRAVLSLIGMLFTSGLGIYAGVQVTGYLMLGCAMLTGSAFLTFMLGFVVLGLAIAGSLMLGNLTQRYIMTGQVDIDFGRAKSWVSGLFGSNKAKPAATVAAAS